MTPLNGGCADEQVTIHRRADCFCPEAGWTGDVSAGRLSQAGHFGCHFLHVALKIRRHFSFGAEAYAATGRGKSAAETAGCRFERRLGDAAGRAGKKEVTLPRLREWGRDLQARYGASERQVCFALRVSRSSFRYRSVAADESPLREITETRVHYGYRRVHVMPRRGGWRDNHKRIHRLYCEKGLSLCLKLPCCNKSAQRRQPQPQGLYPNHVLGMDFVSYALFDGRRLRRLTVIDLYTRECPGICVGQYLRSSEVAEMLNSIAIRRPLPQLMNIDNGSEFAGKMLDRWVYKRGIRIDFSHTGTPTDNATVEFINGRLRQGCLNENWFMSLEDVQCKIEACRIY